MIHSRIAHIAFMTLISAFSIPALADEGRLEINQACAVETGCFAGDAAGFPVTIDGTAGGSYVLTSDLNATDPASDGIRVTLAPVAIDLNGFEVKGPINCSGAGSSLSCGAGVGIGINGATSSAVTVHDGRVSGFGSRGVGLSGIGSRVERVRSSGNGSVGIELGREAIVRDSVASLNGATGISIATGLIDASHASENKTIGILTVFDPSSIQRSTARENGGDGIQGGLGSVIKGNSVASNGNRGIAVGPRSLVVGNIAEASGAAGILVFGNSVIRDNAVANSAGDGISASTGSLIQANTTGSNGGAGIRINSGSSSVLDNMVHGNTLAGIDCTDGGRSYVRGNTVNENGGTGLDLDDVVRPDAIYRDNTVYDNTGGTVNGGNERGGNSCRNLVGAINDCP